MSASILPEIQFDDLDFYEQLSSGSEGVVYRGKVKSRNLIVAIKRTLVLAEEARILGSLKHRNIIQFYGIVSQNPNYCIVTEFAAGGALYYRIMDLKQPDLDHTCYLSWALQIAKGVHYLHDEAPVRIIHRDLKSKNIVLCSNGSDFICKLVDFGTSKQLHHTTALSWKGTVAYMSPETIQSAPSSTSSDAWSYGIVLWEMFARERPFDGLEDMRIAYQVAENNIRLVIPTGCPVGLAGLMTDCWKTNAPERPNFKAIIDRLGALFTSSPDSKKMDQFLSLRQNWCGEIEEQRIELRQKEMKLHEHMRQLHEWESKLTQREAHIQKWQRFQRQQSHDVSSWSVDEVLQWLHNAAFSDAIGAQGQENLAELFRKFQMNGRRLTMLTEWDIERFGGLTPGACLEFIQALRRLTLDNQRLLNFPPLHKAAEQKIVKPKRRPDVVNVAMELYFGAYCCDNKCKVFVDVVNAVEPMIEHPVDLIRDVTFVLGSDHVDRVTNGLPYVLSYWYVKPFDLILNRESDVTKESNNDNNKNVKFIVNYGDMVLEPRNTVQVLSLSSLICAHDTRSVELNVKSMKRSPSVTANGGSNILRHVVSSPQVKGEWMTKRFQDGLTEQYPDTPKRKTDWADVTAGLRQSPSSTTPLISMNDVLLRDRKTSAPSPESNESSPSYQRFASEEQRYSSGFEPVLSDKHFPRTSVIFSTGNDSSYDEDSQTSGLSEEESAIKPYSEPTTSRPITKCTTLSKGAIIHVNSGNQSSNRGSQRRRSRNYQFTSRPATSNDLPNNRRYSVPNNSLSIRNGRTNSRSNYRGNNRYQFQQTPPPYKYPQPPPPLHVRSAPPNYKFKSSFSAKQFATNEPIQESIDFTESSSDQLKIDNNPSSAKSKLFVNSREYRSSTSASVYGGNEKWKWKLDKK